MIKTLDDEIEVERKKIIPPGRRVPFFESAASILRSREIEIKKQKKIALIRMQQLITGQLNTGKPGLKRGYESSSSENGELSFLYHNPDWSAGIFGSRTSALFSSISPLLREQCEKRENAAAVVDTTRGAFPGVSGTFPVVAG